MKQRAMDNPKIIFKFNSVVEKYLGSDDILTGLSVRNTLDDTLETYETGGLFMGIGHEPLTQFLNNSDVKLTSQGYIENTDIIRTSVEGVFTCGDVHDQHYRQAITASGFGCMAAIAVERWLQ
jgi:thioredoxin reductase (NADPH)